MLLNGGHLTKLSIKSPSVSPPIPSFSGICKSKEILLNMGSRIIIVVVQV